MEDAFSVSGFSNWKNATHKLAELSYKQKATLLRKMFSQTSTEQMKASICLEKIVASIGFLAKQGHSFRGHDSDSGNLFELINLRCEDSLELKQWMAIN
ncbi:hypothetical protein PR048_023082 [Dryococelus australis]|uniref:DUF4371 domain-containing protein n=1 Tax=Dryococelus australis TaxID=614101 RepID=A0ABQ9GT41_9NEOP|nr:hypothetical protein PR048_023082 [Dryococelus australis]